jgi:hypothetical protein
MSQLKGYHYKYRCRYKNKHGEECGTPVQKSHRKGLGRIHCVCRKHCCMYYREMCAGEIAPLLFAEAQIR